MKSMRAQIVDAVIAAMKATNIVDARNVHIGTDGEMIDLPCIQIWDKGDQLVEEDAIAIRRSLDLMIVFDVAAGGGVAVNDAFNAVLTAIQTIIGANSQWGGLAEMTTLGDVAVESTPHAELRGMTGAQSISVQFTQNRYDPTKP